MATEKVEAFAAHILEQCEREGLTIAEVNSLPNCLEWEITKCRSEHNRTTAFTCRKSPRGTDRTDA